MCCPLCASSNQAEFDGELNIHFPGFKNLDRPSVLVFPKLAVCLDCGFAGFTIAKHELVPLREADAGA